MIDKHTDREIVSPADRLPSDGTGIDLPNGSDDHAATDTPTTPLDPTAAVVHPVVTLPAVAGFYWGKKKGAAEWQFIIKITGSAPFLTKQGWCRITQKSPESSNDELDFDLGPPVPLPKCDCFLAGVPSTPGAYWAKTKEADHWEYVVIIGGEAPFLTWSTRRMDLDAPGFLSLKLEQLDFGPPVQPPPCAPNNEWRRRVNEAAKKAIDAGVQPILVPVSE